MRKLLYVILAFSIFSIVSPAQHVLNEDPDGIIGEYRVRFQGENTKVRVTKDTDGTFKAQIFWVENRLDDEGNVRLDEKNPDKSLRHMECDRIVLMSGLRYESEKKRWGGTKVYDPTRGIRANATCEFMPDGTLRVKGSLLGVSQSVYWEKMKQNGICHEN